MKMSPEAALARPELWAGEALPFLPVFKARQDLLEYISLLLAWNKKLNLTGASDPLVLLRDLVQDSFFLARFLEDNFAAQRLADNAQIFDLGAGAGLPGVPLRIFWPKGEYSWVERRKKRALFLEIVFSRLRLRGKGFAGDAADFFASGNKGHCIISRAFMPWRELLVFCEPALHENGFVTILANEPAPDMLLPGWRLLNQMAYDLPHKRRWFWALGKAE